MEKLERFIFDSRLLAGEKNKYSGEKEGRSLKRAKVRPVETYFEGI